MTDTTPRPAATNAVRRARRTFLIVAVAFPALVTTAAALVLASWLPSFTEPVAVHWGADGADGFGPASLYLWVLLGVGFVLPVVLTVATLISVGESWGVAARLMGALAAALSAFAAVTAIGSLAIQRDLPPGAEAPGNGAILGLSLAAQLGIGALAWVVQPRVHAPRQSALAPRRAVDIDGRERVVWLGTTTMPRGILVFLGIVLAGMIALAAVMLSTGTAGGWVVLLVTVAVVVGLAVTVSYRVAVTPEGFSATALLGRPRIVIPVGEIERVRAVEISPFAEFGGWGWRVSMDGRSGIVTRRGPAIEIARRSRGAVVVTIDGAADAAALLQAHVDRAATAGGVDQAG